MIKRRQMVSAGGTGALMPIHRGRSALVMAWPRKVLAGFVVLLMAMLVAGCSGSADSAAPLVGDQPVPANGGEGGYQEQAVPMEDGDAGGDTERMIIRTKVLRLEVEKTVDAVEAIRKSARTHDGTISDLEVATDSEGFIYRYDEDGNPEGSGSELRGWVTVRVPTDGYEAFVAEVAKLGVVKFQSEASSDVTQEYVDLSARLENLRAQEARLREFFDAAKDVDDMLAVEVELGRVRGDIESMDAQVTYLERQAAMATITVELTEPRDVVRPGGESWGFVEAITSGVRGAAAVITGLLSFMIAASPLLILGGIALLVLRPILQRRRERATKVSTPWSAASPQTAPTSTGETEVSPQESPTS